MLADDPPEPHRPPLQFGLRTLFAVAVALALVFGTLRWLGVPELAGFIVLGVLAASVLAALALVVAIAGNEEDD